MAKIRNEEIEKRVEDVISAHWNFKLNYKKHAAKAAIAEYRKAMREAGYVLVPSEPTEVMTKKFIIGIGPVWTAMIEASQKDKNENS